MNIASRADKSMEGMDGWIKKGLKFVSVSLEAGEMTADPSAPSRRLGSFAARCQEEDAVRDASRNAPRGKPAAFGV